LSQKLAGFDLRFNLSSATLIATEASILGKISSRQNDFPIRNDSFIKAVRTCGFLRFLLAQVKINSPSEKSATELQLRWATKILARETELPSSGPNKCRPAL
jgi:hypothetical protein